MTKRTRDERFKEMTETDALPPVKRRAGLERLIRPLNGALDQLTDDVLIYVIRLCIDYGYGVEWILNPRDRVAAPALLTVSKHVSWAFKVGVIQHVQAMLHTYRSQWKATEGYMAYPLVDFSHEFRVLATRFKLPGPVLLRYVAGNIFRAPISLEQWRKLLEKNLINSGTDMTQRIGKMLRSYIPRWSGRFAESCMSRVSFMDLLLASLFENVNLEWSVIFDVWWTSDDANPEDLHWLWPVLWQCGRGGLSDRMTTFLARRSALHVWSLTRHVHCLFPALESVDVPHTLRECLADFYRGNVLKTVSSLDWGRRHAGTRIVPDIRLWARMLEDMSPEICHSDLARIAEPLKIIRASPFTHIEAEDWADQAVGAMDTTPSRIILVIEDTGLNGDLALITGRLGVYTTRCLQFIRAYIRKHLDDILEAYEPLGTKIRYCEIAMKLVAEQIPVGPARRETQAFRILLATTLMNATGDLTAFDIRSLHPLSPGESVFDIHDPAFLRGLFSVDNIWRLHLDASSARDIVEYVHNNVVIDETVIPASYLVSCAYHFTHDELSSWFQGVPACRMFFDICPPSILTTETFHQCLSLIAGHCVHADSGVPALWLWQFYERLLAKDETLGLGPFMYPSERVPRMFAPSFAYGWYMTVAMMIDHHSKHDSNKAFQLRQRYLKNGVDMGLFDSLTVVACVVADDQKFGAIGEMTTVALPALDHTTLDMAIRCASSSRLSISFLMRTLKRMPGAAEFLGDAYNKQHVHLADIVALQNGEHL